MSNSPVVTHPFVVEDLRPLSRSRLWDIQRHLYAAQGVQAWRAGGVPHYITSNPYVAKSYARVTLAHLRSVLRGSDVARRRGARILELGAGAGRFAFHFLTEFLAMWRDSELADVPVTYVMTDVTARNVDFWRAHPAFASFLERGQLVLSVCDAENPADLRRVLETSAPAQREGPLVVFANYVFDGLRSELFYCDEDRLFLGLVALKSSGPELDPLDPLSSLAIEVGRRELDRGPYEDPLWNTMLDGYRARGGGGALLFPTTALECLDTLRSLSPESLFVLCADEGSPRAEDAGRGSLRLLDNGKVSLPEFPVNFHALGEYTLAHGGQPAFSRHGNGGICLGALIWDATGRDSGATRQAFHDTMDPFGPEELFHVVKSLERTGAQLTCEEMLAHLRWSGWDAKVLHMLLPHLAERLPAVPLPELAAWSEALERVWALHYHVDGDDGDFAFGIGALLARLGQWRGAVVFLERSLQTWGIDGSTLLNLAVCHMRLGNRTPALTCVERALVEAPGNTLALRLQRELTAPGT
jgi:hypothetical protein